MTELKPYVRPVHYYETDRMAIVHHSNYIRWFEEARLHQLSQLGIDYSSMEEQGILIPVVDVSCKYHRSVRYGDTVEIRPILTHYNGVRMTYQYEVRICGSDVLAATGTSCHCFVDCNQRPFSLKKKSPDLHQKLSDLIEPE